MSLRNRSEGFGILVAAGACVFLSFANCGCSQVKADEFEIQAVELMQKQEFSKAIDKLNASIKLNPNKPGVYLKRGNCYQILKQYNQAFEDYNKALSFKDESDRHKSLAYQARGLAYLNTGKYKEGIDDETNAINLTPRADAYLARGRCKAASKDFRGALSDYDKGLKLDPDSGLGLIDEGGAKLLLKDFKGAIADYSHSLELKMNDQNRAEAYLQRSVARYFLHDYKGALEDDDRALKITPNDAEGLQFRGNAEFALGDKAGAEKDYAAAKKATYHYDSHGAHLVMPQSE